MFSAPKDIHGPNAFRLFVEELGGPEPVSRFLGVTLRTVKRWQAAGRVPRAAVLALYWETHYGRSQMFAHQVNEIRLLYRRACLLQEQYTRAKDIITGLRRLHTGTANEALFEELENFHELPPNTYGASVAAADPASQRAAGSQSNAAAAADGQGKPHIPARAQETATAFDAQRRAVVR